MNEFTTVEVITLVGVLTSLYAIGLACLMYSLDKDRKRDLEWLNQQILIGGEWWNIIKFNFDIQRVTIKHDDYGILYIHYDQFKESTKID